ncbi:MAG: ABC transporter permease [Armatimonadetes bacterium]|nr:MAG: ABC transporter permease [Armatimonadota bacterium]
MTSQPSLMKLLWGQAGYQNKVFFRNPTAAFFTLLFPLMIFVVFALIFGNEYIEELGINVAQYYAPAMAVFAAVSATYTNLAVTTAYQRDEGILKRVKGTPLPPSIYMGGKILSAIMIAIISVVIMMSIGVVFYGVNIYAATLPAVIVTFLVGVGCFAALGLMVAALVSSGESATAVTNATLLPLAFISGVFIVPSEEAPAWLDTVANIFPLKHFVEPFVAAFNPLNQGSGFDWVSLGVMALWGAVAIVIAVRFFKWEASPGSSRKPRRGKKVAAEA